MAFKKVCILRKSFIDKNNYRDAECCSHCSHSKKGKDEDFFDCKVKVNKKYIVGIVNSTCVCDQYKKRK